MVAILINFSLFTAKVFVDGSNLATLQLYQATKSDGDITKKQDEHNISTRIMTTLGFSTIYSIGDIFKGGITSTIRGCGGAQGTIISVAVFGSIFMIILGLAFLTVGLMFFTRMANIIYLLVTSPLWVWGHILDSEPFVKIRTDWWKRMMRVVKFPVVFMLYMFVAMFAFTKMFALSYGGMSFLTLFCVSDDTSIIGQLPLILNFCLVIWVILAAVKYGMENSEGGFEKAISGKLGGWAQSASTGLAKKIGDRARDGAQKIGDKAQKIVAAAPKATLYGAGQVGKGLFQAGGGFKGLNKFGAKIAANGSAPAFIRNIGANLADRTKDPKFFGKTVKERKDAWKKYWGEGGEEDAKRTVEAAESLMKAPKFREDGHDLESNDDYKKRIEAYALAKSKIYLSDNLLDVQDDQNGKKSHRTGILEDAVEEVKDSTGKATGEYKLNEEKMRRRIKNAFEAHTEKGRLKASGTHKKSKFMANAKFEARQKAFKAATATRHSEAKTIEKNKDDLKKAEESLKNHPETLADLEKSIDDAIKSNDDSKLKGVVNMSQIRGLQLDIEKLAGDPKDPTKAGSIERNKDDLSRNGHYMTDDQKRILQEKIYKEEIALEKQKAKLKGIKEGAVTNRDKIQKKIEELKEKIKEQEKKK